MSNQTFIVLADNDSKVLQDRVIKEFGENDNVYVLRENSQWLVAADMTTVQVANKLKYEELDGLGMVVFLVSNYWGRHHSDLWEWLELD